MTTILIGITFVILGLVFNKAGNSRIKEPVDLTEYYTGATLAYFAGIILIQMGAILMMLRYTEGF